MTLVCSLEEASSFAQGGPVLFSFRVLPTMVALLRLFILPAEQQVFTLKYFLI